MLSGLGFRTRGFRTARTDETAPALDLAARSFHSFIPHQSQLLPKQGMLMNFKGLKE